MPSLQIEMPADVSPSAIKAVQTELRSCGRLYEEPVSAREPASILMGISLVSDVLQGIDVLVNWLQRTPRANKAVIRFSDGRTLRLEDTDAEAFRKALKAALKER